MLEKITKLSDYLTLIALFLLPWQTRYIIEAGKLNNGPYEYLSISLYGTDLLILLALLASTLAILFDKNISNKIKHRPYWLLVVGLLFFDCFSIFVSTDRLIVLYVFGRLAVGISLAWLIIKNKFSFNKILSVLLAAIVLQSALACWQFPEQTVVGNKWLGMATHHSYDSGVSAATIEINPVNHFPERWLRAYGSLDHPNMLGGLTALGLLIAVYLFVNLYQFGYSRLKEISLSSAIILTTAGLFLSFSRTALLGAGLGLFFLSFVHLKKWRRLLLSFFFIIATAGLLFYNYGQLYYTRFEPLTGISTASVVDRKTYIQESFSLIKKHPLFGVGAGNYGLALNQAVDKKINSYYYQPVHNFWLMLFTEIGLFGLICIVFLFFKLIIDSLKNLKQAREAKLIVACLLLTFAISLFDHWLWSLHFGVLFFWTIIGLSIKTLAK